jgi:quinol monooxygenase YgiN
MHGLIGKFTAQSGQRDRLVKLMYGDGEPLPGLLSFVIAQDPADADVVRITELWEDKESHTLSLQIPKIKASIAEAMPLIKSFDLNVETTPVLQIGV